MLTDNIGKIYDYNKIYYTKENKGGNNDTFSDFLNDFKQPLEELYEKEKLSFKHFKDLTTQKYYLNEIISIYRKHISNENEWQTLINTCKDNNIATILRDFFNIPSNIIDIWTIMSIIALILFFIFIINFLFIYFTLTYNKIPLKQYIIVSTIFSIGTILNIILIFSKYDKKE